MKYVEGFIDEMGLEWLSPDLKSLETVDIGQGVHFLQEDNPRLIMPEFVARYGAIEERRLVLGKSAIDGPAELK